jgi:hypothetical protein
MKFLVDESLSTRVAELLQANGHDAVHVADLGLLGAIDPIVMQTAADAGRVLVTADTDFGELLALGAIQDRASSSSPPPASRRAASTTTPLQSQRRRGQSPGRRRCRPYARSSASEAAADHTNTMKRRSQPCVQDGGGSIGIRSAANRCHGPMMSCGTAVPSVDGVVRRQQRATFSPRSGPSMALGFDSEDDMSARTGAERYFAKQMEDPAYRAARAQARARIARTDVLAHSLVRSSARSKNIDGPRDDEGGPWRLVLILPW